MIDPKKLHKTKMTGIFNRRKLRLELYSPDGRLRGIEHIPGVFYPSDEAVFFIEEDKQSTHRKG
jgi:hypothetical protein